MSNTNWLDAQNVSDIRVRGSTLDAPGFSTPLTASKQEERFVISVVIVNPEPFSQHDHVEVVASLMLNHLSKSCPFRGAVFNG